MADNPHSAAPDLGETQARQGAWGQSVFWVLAFSTVLAIIAVGAVWLYHAPRMAQVTPTARNPAIAQNFHSQALPPDAPALEPGRKSGT